MVTKEVLHELIDQLPDSDIPAVERLLADPLLRVLLSTPEGEEPLTAEEIAGIMEAKRDEAAGRIKRFSNVNELLADLQRDAER